MSVSVYGYYRDSSGLLRLLPKDPDEVINWSNMNASAILGTLDLLQGDLFDADMLPIEEVQGAISRAKKEGAERAREHTKDETRQYGPPRQIGDNVIEMRPLRLWEGGITEEYIWAQIGRLEQYLIMLKEQGASLVSWA